MTDTVFEDEFSEEIWRTTYKDSKDITIDDTMKRVAKGVAKGEKNKVLCDEWTEKFYDMLTGFKVTSGGRIYSNAGAGWKGTTLMNCISGDTLIHTKSGLIPANKLENEQIDILSKDGIFRSSEWYCYGEQQLYNVELSSGDIIRATNEHEWVVTSKNGTEKVKTKDLFGRYVRTTGREYEIENKIEFKNGIQHGMVYGDGWIYMKSSKNPKTMIRQFNDNIHLLEDYFDKCSDERKYKSGLTYKECTLLPLEYKTTIPTINYSNSYIAGFIAGFIASDGCVDSNGRITAYQSNIDDLNEIKILANKIGISITSICEYGKKSPGRFDNDKPLFVIRFSKQMFPEKLIIKHTHKNKYIPTIRKSTPTYKVINITKDNIEPVYCCVEPETHTMVIGNCILTGQCFAGPRGDYDIDSLEGILTSLRNQAQTLKSEGGWGDNFSYIRPRGSFIHGIGVESPGSVKYMELFDMSSDIITSGSGKKSLNKKAKGKIRKGAMMGVLDIWHPDIVEFITAKQSAGRLSKFNVSVNITDEFMEKILKIEDMKKDGASEEEIELMDQWPLRFPDTTFEKYKSEWNGNFNKWIENEYPVIIYDTISATMLFNLIMDSTYNRAEPGVLFLDRANYYNPLNYRDTIYTTNPCGEQTLAPAGVCDLASANLTQFIIIHKDGSISFDFKKLKKYIPIAVRFLDNINTVSNAPLPEYEDSMNNKRRIGVGILGWGSLLFMMKIRFASNESDELRDKIMKLIAQESYKSSIDLAEEKGMFKYCEPEKHAKNPFIVSLNLPKPYMDKLRKTGIRNSAILSIQPTGNTSIFANIVSGGLEPIFMPEYVRTVIVNIVPDHIMDVTPKWFEGQWFETDMFKFDKEGDEEILKGVDSNGTVYKIDKNRGLTKEVQCEDYGVRWLKKRNEWNPEAKWAVTTVELSAEEHLSDMKGFARWIDSAISKTINIPNDYPYEDFKNIYIDAYKSNYIKGITTYRAGTMTTVLAAKDEKHADISDEEIILDDVKMPDSAPAVMKTIRAEGKKWYLTIVYNETTNRPFALFVKTNSHEKTVVTNDAVDLLIDFAKNKNIPKSHIESVIAKIGSDSNASKITRIISFLLRHGVLIKNICLVLDKVEDVYVGSFIFQIKKFLQTYIKDGETVDGEKCSECGGKMIYSEGCFKCMDCGSSKCG